MTARDESPDAAIPARPSQAEGDRETVEADLGERGGGDTETSGAAPDPLTRPSQAEGDRETVEEDLAGRGRGGV